MPKKNIHIIILCLFVISTIAAPAYASCKINSSKENSTMSMPCHQDAKNDDGDGCCGNSCGYLSGCISVSIIISESDFLTSVTTNKYFTSPTGSLMSVVHAVPGSPPKQLS